MSEKLRQLGRMKALREGRERLSEASVAMAAAKLREAEQRLDDVRAVRAAEMEESQRAIAVGERPAWMLALALSKADARDCARLAAECVARKDSMMAAQRILQACRIETEQASLLEKDLREVLMVERERREQAESDDRFAARSRWDAMREGLKTLIVEM